MCVALPGGAVWAASHCLRSAQWAIALRGLDCWEVLANSSLYLGRRTCCSMRAARLHACNMLCMERGSEFEPKQSCRCTTALLGWPGCPPPPLPPPSSPQAVRPHAGAGVHGSCMIHFPNHA